MATTTSTTTTTTTIAQIVGEYTVRKVVSLSDPAYFCNRSWTVSFNFNTKSWTSFHTYLPNWYIGENNFFYSGINSCCDDFDFIAGTLVPNPTTTSTTSTTKYTTTTTTTSTTMDCSLEGVINIIYCGLEGVVYDMGTTPCTTPVDYVSYNLISGYSIVSPSGSVDSTLTWETACAAEEFLATYTGDPTNVYPTYVHALTDAIAVGSIVYLDIETDCTCVSDGWYFTDDLVSLGLVFHIEDCVITEFFSCEATTTTTTTTTSYTTTSTTTTTTTGIPVACGTMVTQSDNPSYPFIQPVDLGASTGVCMLTHQTYSLPDRVIVMWNGSVQIDVGYVGDASYDVGGLNRYLFTTTLTGLVDPITGHTYPNLTDYPTDGYPSVTDPGYGVASFNKNLASPDYAFIEIYAPVDGTIWDVTLGCPGVTTTTTTTAAPTTTTTTTPVPTTTTTTTLPTAYKYYYTSGNFSNRASACAVDTISEYGYTTASSIASLDGHYIYTDMEMTIPVVGSNLYKAFTDGVDRYAVLLDTDGYMYGSAACATTTTTTTSTP